MNKVNITVKKEVKMDSRTNNTGRPVSPKSARQQRLAKQAFYADVHNKFVSGQSFKVNNITYAYESSDSGSCIFDVFTGSYVCNVEYVGRTKVTGFTYVLGKKVNVTLNLKTLEFVK
tara:strand:+ start:63 stop:413 length:351 start_codon:yes stop_codon:yes gene_type:complete